MLTKLTLSIEKDVVDRAKHYAQGRRKSVSRLVEEYLSRISSSSLAEPIEGLDAPITESLVGMFPDDGRDYQELIDEARAERFR